MTLLGKVYLFQSVQTDGESKGTWALAQKILGEAGSRLGSCVSLTGGNLLIGADFGGE